MRSAPVVVLSFVGATVAAQGSVTWEDVAALLSRHEGTFEGAIEKITEARDPSLLAGLNDVLYLHYVTRQPRRAQAISEAMEAIAGEELEGRSPRRAWAEWIGRHEEITPKDGYLVFKRTVFESYDPVFRGYLNPRFSFHIRPEEIEWGGVRKDGIPALDEPGFLEAARADFLEEDERVFGVFLNGEAKAYPHRILDAHEMANDVVGGRPVSLSYCTLCGSGILFAGDHPSREDKGPFTFGSSGLLYRSNKLMYDRPTNSLWSNLTGRPVAGRLADSGVELEKLPLVVSTWSEWRKRHPQTLVLDPENTGFDRDYSESPYQAYFDSDELMFPVWLQNDALAAKSTVFAIVLNGRPKAYPMQTLRQEGVTHDRVGGKDIVLLTDRDSGAVRAYESTGSRFTATLDATTLKDEDGESWRVEEDYLAGPAHDRLPRIPGHNAFWFGWYAFYPTTELYEP